MWLDNASDIDILFYSPYAKYVASIVCDLSNTPLTVGLFGKWGAGKSSLINLIKDELAQKETTIVVDTNAWLYEGYTDAKTSMMETIATELSECQSIKERFLDKCASLFKRIDKLKLTKILLSLGVQATGLLATGLPPSLAGILGAAKDATDAIQGDEIRDSAVTTISEFRKEFKELISSLDEKTVVFIIDDLDRCSPDRIIDTLEAIKLFLSVKGTVFIIAADDEVIEYAISQKYPGLKESKYSKEYIEKIIQLPINIPTLSVKDIENYLLLLVAQNSLRAEKFTELLDVIMDKRLHTRDSRMSLAELNRLIGELKDNPFKGYGGAKEQYEKVSVVIDGIREIVARVLDGNPRQAKRFLNTFMTKKELAEIYFPGEIDSATLAKLLTLHRISSDLFNQLYDWNNLYDGHIPYLREAINGEDKDNGDWAKETIQKWAMCPPINIEDTPLDRYFYLTRESIVRKNLIPILSTEGKMILHRILTASVGIMDKVFEDLRSMPSGDQNSVLDVLMSTIEKAENKWMIAEKIIDCYPAHTERMIDLLSTLNADLPALPFYKVLLKNHAEIVTSIEKKTKQEGTTSIIRRARNDAK